MSASVALPKTPPSRATVVFDHVTTGAADRCAPARHQGQHRARAHNPRRHTRRPAAEPGHLGRAARLRGIGTCGRTRIRSGARCSARARSASAASPSCPTLRSAARTTSAASLATTWSPSPVRTAVGFRSTFAPPDARPRGTERNSRGRQGTAGAVDQPFVHVTGDDRDRAKMEGTRGEPPLRPVKSPALPSQVRILSLPHSP
jgi:hypothetical protein